MALIIRGQQLALNGTKELRDVFFPKLRRLLECYERTVGAPLPINPGFARHDVMPKFGSARHVQIPKAINIEASAPPIVAGDEQHYVT